MLVCLAIIVKMCGFHLLVDEVNLLKPAEQEKGENLLLGGAGELLRQSVLELFCILTSYDVR